MRFEHYRSGRLDESEEKFFSRLRRFTNDLLSLNASIEYFPKNVDDLLIHRLFVQALVGSQAATQEIRTYPHRKSTVYPRLANFGTRRVVVRLQYVGQQSNSVQASW